MKHIITGTNGTHAEEIAIGEVHLDGLHGNTACGIDSADYHWEKTNKNLTCITCRDYLAWAKDVAKHIKR